MNGIIFSDEANFEVYIRKKECFNVVNQKININLVMWKVVQSGGGSYGIWGCITSKRTGVLCIYQGCMNSNKYRETLEQCLIPSI